MARVETVILPNGEERFRVVERAPDGRCVKGPLMHSRPGAEPLAGRDGFEKGRDEVKALDHQIATELWALLRPCREATREQEQRFRDVVDRTLERPQAVLSDLSDFWSGRLIDQYHAEAVDPAFERLFEERRRTARGTSKHEEIEAELRACCVPETVPEPPAWAPETTRFVLPFTTEAAALPGPRPAQLCSLLPFLSEIVRLRVEGPGDGAPIDLLAEVVARGPSGMAQTAWERLAVRTATHVKGGTAAMVRIRAPDTAAQLGLALDADLLPAAWRSVFGSDVYAVLPIRVRLGCGVGVSHRFELQSGRTHLIRSDKNAACFADIAVLASALPTALCSLAWPDRPLRAGVRAGREPRARA